MTPTSGNEKPGAAELYRAVELHRQIYARHSAGCCLHIVLDDGNYSDENVRFCMEWAQQKRHSDCVELASILLRMSRTQRDKLSRGGYKAFAEEWERRQAPAIVCLDEVQQFGECDFEAIRQRVKRESESTP